jgi:hypothetical protein
MKIMTVVMVVALTIAMVFIITLWNKLSFHPYCDGTTTGYNYRPYHPYAMYLLIMWILIFIHVLFAGIRAFTNPENKNS